MKIDLGSQMIRPKHRPCIYVQVRSLDKDRRTIDRVNEHAIKRGPKGIGKHQKASSAVQAAPQPGHDAF